MQSMDAQAGSVGLATQPYGPCRPWPRLPLLPIPLSLRMHVRQMPDTDSRKNRLSQNHHPRNLSQPVFCLNLILPESYLQEERKSNQMPARKRKSVQIPKTSVQIICFTSMKGNRRSSVRHDQQQGTILLWHLTSGNTCSGQSYDSSSAASHNRSLICCSSANCAALLTRKGSALAFQEDSSQHRKWKITITILR